MFKFREWALLGAGAALLSFGLVAAQARDARPARTSEPVGTSTEAIVAPAAEAKAQVGQSAAEKIVEAPCARKVKVVYAGYGEGDRAACAAK